MNCFMIGMHGRYDFNKFNRDFLTGFYGVEVCSFKTEEEIEFLVEQSFEKDFKYGVHFPLRAGVAEFRDAQFLALNDEVRKKAFVYIENDLRYIKERQLKPEYILFHYPKPVVIKEDFDMDNWRFADRSEYAYESEYSFEEFKSKTEDLFNWLSNKAIEYNFVPVLEFDALNKYLCESDFLEERLNTYNTIRICLDTGRLQLQSLIDKSFDAINIIERFAKYTDIVHLWNARIGENNHYPALPCLKEEDGWAPIEKYLGTIKQKNNNFKVMFEHRSDLISDQQLYSCYSWIKSIIEGE
ncbi:sugar phosphate isomerase/epimerase [Clostridium manihotivorum]|uniref:Sugar phosphate isomerase/epimerase n=1 Tax=Clostridium manihotivorum TaxID=2320868 RepID=A0A3R5QUV1_9CLOT|nr:sugar phosphate isomerase/epimerase [Clostridium manihotivorum]QAA33179.1 hypothetical protein C1I91_16895 [Clostridium manihotivorum]